MLENEPCTLIYEDEKGHKHTFETKVTSLKTDTFGITFYNKELSMLNTVTWDRIKSFHIEGIVTKDLVENSKVHQDYFSDRRKGNKTTRTAL